MSSDDEQFPPGYEASIMSAYAGKDYTDPYREDPVRWIEEVCGETLWADQKTIARAVASNSHVAWKACHGVGKSWLFARIIAWWVCTHPPSETYVIFTAPTFAQVWGIIGKELGIVHTKAGLPGRLLNRNTEWWIGDVLVAVGLKPDDNNDNAFQGRHARYTLGIGDEADGLPASIWTGLDAISTTEDARTAVAGNPMDPSGEFATVCGDNVNADKEKAWDDVYTTSVFDTPNFTGEDIPDDVRVHLVSRSWLEKRRKRWGIGSNMWEGRVMGRFPASSEERLIDPAWIAAACKRELSGHELGRFSLDVARFGDSETVLYRNRGGVIRIVDSAFSSSGPDVKRMARSALDAARGQAPLNIDGDGVGGPVYDDLNEENHAVFEFRGGTRADEPEDFVNKRSEAYWILREAFRMGQVDLDPEDKVLVAQLSNIKWKLKNGKTAVETKDEMRKRGIPSPDRADGAMMSVVYLGDAPYALEQTARRMALMAAQSGGTPIGSQTAGLLDEAM